MAGAAFRHLMVFMAAHFPQRLFRDAEIFGTSSGLFWQTGEINEAKFSPR
jgi:hypothetical protein